MKEIEKHYKTREAAALIGVHPRTVANWIASGQLGPVIAVSMRDFRIPASVLLRFIEQREVGRVRFTQEGEGIKKCDGGCRIGVRSGVGKIISMRG